MYKCIYIYILIYIILITAYIIYLKVQVSPFKKFDQKHWWMHF